MIRQNRSQVIIITLWIMIILSLLAISVANRVSLGLRLSKYARDAVKADALAIAGLNRAAKEINGDTNQFDALNEAWAGDEKKFKDIKLDGNNEAEVFSVVYYQADPNGKLSPVYGVCDEDRKININAADEGLLRVLLEEFNANHPEKLAKNILAWRGDPNIPADDPSRDYSLKRYSCKGKPFSNIEELLLVKEMPQDIYIRIRDFITVQTDPTQIKVNINTASPEVMRSLLKYSVNQLNQNAATIDAGIAESLFTMINNFLRAGNNFSDAANLSIGLQQYINGPSYSQYENVLNQLGQYVRPASQYFRIISVGSVKTSVLSRKLEYVYDKAAGKMVFWHQN